ncbi:cyclopropane-fatty-acyl-phospholipid synthase family protein [Streptomyces enissocaesilis]|uniref:Cyclopropane-fatty-acyl-phospholipid synthase n=1 Tax=Streptomyces enissocaesilis TaxID=332589 RepID=A0ABP6K3N0_9ACTN
MSGETTALDGAGPDDIRFHYDVGTPFFALWLDPELTYSCALWDDVAGPDEDSAALQEAQRAKVDYHLKQAGVVEGSRLLDVGCGWGSLLARSVQTAGGAAAVSATGLTLSRDQYDHVRSLRLPGAEVRLEHWRDHRPSQPYDAVVSIGAFEHFAQPGMDADERIAAYHRFFEAAFQWLPARGRLSLQSIALDDVADQDGPLRAFFTGEVFPQSALPRLSQILRAADPLFSLSALRVDPDDYVRTLRCWTARLDKNREQADQLVGPPTTRGFLRYLRVSQHVLQRRLSTLYRITLERRRSRLPLSL